MEKYQLLIKFIH